MPEDSPESHRKSVYVHPLYRSDWLKAIISNAANSAIKWNPIIIAYNERLVKRGKCEGIRRNNVKNKIIQTVVAMIRKGEKFDPEFKFTNEKDVAEC